VTAGLALSGAALGLAFAPSLLPGRSDPRISAALGALLLAMILQAILRLALTGGPYFGWTRLAFHADQASRLATALVPAWLGFVVLGEQPERRATRALALAWGALLLVAIVAYPFLRPLPLDGRIARARIFYGAVDVASSSIGIACVVRSRLAAPDLALARAESVAAMLIAGDAVLLVAGALPRGLFGAAYSAQQAGLSALYLLVAARRLLGREAGP
jgi:hypothetical protein